MKIYTAKGSGFCFGVRRAMDMAYRCAVKNARAGVYSYHEIIHNPQEVRKLEASGARHVEEIDGIKNGSTVIVSTHGITPAEEGQLREKQAQVLDTTCPYVKKIHLIVEKLAAEGYAIVIVGDREHLEVKGILGYAGKNSLVINDIRAARKYRPGKKTGIVSQTTQNENEYREIIEIIMGKAFRIRQAEVRVFHTICDATQLRQDEVVKLARKADAMIIIGGKNSANTKRLYRLSRKALKNTHHVEDAAGIKKAWFKRCRAVGISGGASTPDESIKKVVEKIREMV